MSKEKKPEFSQEYNSEVQKILLSIFIADPDLFAKCRTIIRDEYFDDQLQPMVRFILQHADTYRSIPTVEMIDAKSGIKLSVITPDVLAQQKEWFCQDFEGFCKHRALENVILDGADLLRDGKGDEVLSRVKDALTIRLMSDLGTDYFIDPETRLRRMLESEARISTGLKMLDDPLFGGFDRGGLNIFLGNSGCVIAKTKVRIIKLVNTQVSSS